MALNLLEPTLNNTVGALLLGLCAASFLDGVITVQMYQYYYRLKQDFIRHIVAVALLWILDFMHLALTIHVVYTYIITGWGDFAGLERILWSIKLQVILNVVIVVLVHALYVSRVWILGGYHNGILGYLAAAFVGGGFVVGVILANVLYGIDSFDDLGSISWAIYASLATATIIDFTISVAMCYYLWKSEGTETKLNLRISRMMQYTVGSGLLTTACSLSTLFTYWFTPNTFVFLGVEFLLTKLYVGSFFAMLNARERSDLRNNQSSTTLPGSWVSLRTPPWNHLWPRPTTRESQSSTTQSCV